MADIVYICRPGEQNEELRHSLRSVAENFPHERVFIVGDAPSWVRRVEILHSPLKKDKQLTALANLIAACQSPRISDPFYVFNDDFFVMHPMSEIPYLNLGPMPEVINRHAFGSAYRRAMERTYERMQNIGCVEPMVSYELHIPMLIEKLGMLMALSLGEGIHGLHNRTMYGNLMQLTSETAKDVKVYRSDKPIDYSVMPLLSTSDRTFQYHRVGHYIRKTLDRPSIYEVAPPKRTAIRYSSIVTRP